jgi:hypothetical protein
MKLLTDQQRTQLLANGRAAREAQRTGAKFDPQPVVKFYIPDGYGRWLLTEMDPSNSIAPTACAITGSAAPISGTSP